MELTKSKIILPKVIGHLSQDPIMEKIVQSTKLRTPSKHQNVFNALVSSIISQQLSTTVASVINDRVRALFVRKQIRPIEMLAMDEDRLRGAGLSKQKLNYMRNIALFFNTQGNKRIAWKKLSDQEIIDRLTEIKGVGVWTVQMILMFTLERPDVFPSGDLGIQMSIKKHYNVKAEKRALINKMEELAEQWSPYRTFASRYLWAALEN